MPGKARIMLSISLLLLLVLVSACSIAPVGTIPRGTPDTGNGTPAVLPTATANTQAIAPAPSNSMGASYAFVRDEQLWVALNGASPLQITNFNYTNRPNVFWHQPLWSPGDHYLAFIMDAVPMGLGGGGCPAPDFGANGALYVLNTGTGNITQLQVPMPKQGVLASSSPQNDSWQYMFWEDSSHLLAWYNGTLGSASNSAGLYQYDIQAQTLTQLLPLHTLGVATLFAPQSSMPLLLSMHYSSGQLFYQVVVHPFEQHSQLIIDKVALASLQQPVSNVLVMGNEGWCMSSQGNAYVKPGWDVSPDGEQVVAQMIVAGDTAQGVGTVQVLNMRDNSTTPLFAEAATDVLGHDVILNWGPDSQTVVLSTPHLLTEHGPYSATLANPSATLHYLPNVAGQIVWRPDGKAFALQSGDALDPMSASNIYVFQTDNTEGFMLLANARNFTWG